MFFTKTSYSATETCYSQTCAWPSTRCSDGTCAGRDESCPSGTTGTPETTGRICYCYLWSCTNASYSCNSGDELSDKTCYKYTCPDGGTLNQTTKMCER